MHSQSMRGTRIKNFRTYILEIDFIQQRIRSSLVWLLLSKDNLLYTLGLKFVFRTCGRITSSFTTVERAHSAHCVLPDPFPRSTRHMARAGALTRTTVTRAQKILLDLADLWMMRAIRN